MSPRNLSSSGKNNIKFKSDHFAPRWLTTAIERGRGEVMKLSRLIIIIVPLLPPTLLITRLINIHKYYVSQVIRRRKNTPSAVFHLQSQSLYGHGMRW